MFPGAHAATDPDRAAVVMAGGGQTLTYRELDEEANRLSRALRGAGLRVGDHVAFCIENHPRFFPVLWGAHYAGLRYTAISSRLTTEEMAYIVDDCGARAFVTSSYKAAQATELADRMPAVLLRLVLDGPIEGYEDYDRVVRAESPEPLVGRVEGGDMLYSSGTTGLPKGVKKAAPDAPLGTPEGLTSLVQLLFGFDRDTRYLSPAPLYHAAPLRFCRSVHRLGGTTVVMERFDPETFLALVERHRITASQLVPTMFVRMLKLPQAARSRHDLSSLRAAVHAAAPCPVEVKEAMIDWWGPVIHEYYAGTEGNGLVHCDSHQWLDHRGTVGKAVLGTAHILDESGEELAAGETGTVYFDSDVEFEYHNDPDKTRAAADPAGRGWTTIGDVGHLDEDGYLFLTDRREYTIIVGGVNVYPQEAEDILVMHPAVADVAVFGVPDEDLGEQVKAVVALMSAEDAGPGLEQELIAYCRTRLADFKCPRSIDFRAELPRQPTGKLYKRLLRDEYWRRLLPRVKTSGAEQ